MSKYYCFYDTKIKKILRISPVNKSRDIDSEFTVSFEIDNNLAIDILKGKKSYSTLVVIKLNGKYILNEKEVLIKKIEKKLDLIDTLPLLEIYQKEIQDDINDINLMDIKLTFFKVAKKLKIDIIKEIQVLIKEPICFYITKKNDPSSLVNVIKLDNINKHNIFDIEYTIEDYSIFTKRIFDNYYMEFLNA